MKLIAARICAPTYSYLNEIDRITAKKYIPTDGTYALSLIKRFRYLVHTVTLDDVLKARLKTVGVIEHAFTLTHNVTKPMTWKIYDVGGARNQRQAWAPYFQDSASYQLICVICLIVVLYLQ